MKITEDVRKYAAEQGIRETDVLEKGLKEKSKEFVEKGLKFTRSCGSPMVSSRNDTLKWAGNPRV